MKADPGAAALSSLEEGKRLAAALCSPRNVVLAGVSNRPGTISRNVLENLQRFAFPGAIQLVNPHYDEIAGLPCYPDFDALPEPPDHVLVLVPAPSVPDLVRNAAAAGARTAVIYAGGFGEGDGSGESIALRDRLDRVIRASGIGVCGPNCMGTFVARSRLVTMGTSPAIADSGSVALVGQSGGVVLHLATTLAQRGIGTSHIISSGNELGLTTADYIAYLAGDPDVRVIFCYTEAIRDIAKFVAACRLVRDAGKPVVAFRIGQSEQGREAALAHTGSLAGSTRMFDAIAGEHGVMRVDTMDGAVQLIELLLGAGIPAGRGLGVVTLSGALRGVVTDAADRAGLLLPPLAEPTLRRLREVMLPGAPVSNPLDGGYSVMSSAETMASCVEAVAADPAVDIVLVQSDWSPDLENTPIGLGMAATAEFARTRSPKPVAFISMLTQSDTDYTRRLRLRLDPIPFLQEPNAALAAIAVAARSRVAASLAGAPADGAQSPVNLPAGLLAKAGVVDEIGSKSLIAAYGIPILSEEPAGSAEEAVAAANRLGYPVVMKILSDVIAHKADVGGVMLDLRNDAAVVEAYASIRESVARHGFDADRVLIAPMIKDGVELALGLINDPEMGIGAMVSSGGALLELNGDAVFAAVPINRDKARDMLRRTKAWPLLQGYRGTAPADIEAVVDAIIALGRLGVELGERIEALDVNPLLARPEGRGAVALDALVVMRESLPVTR